jgi:hypothetical protein
MNGHKGWVICHVAISGSELPRMPNRQTSETSVMAKFGTPPAIGYLRCSRPEVLAHRRSCPRGARTLRLAVGGLIRPSEGVSRHTGLLR